MLDAVQVEEQSYILATTRRDEHTLVLKSGDTFAVFDPLGDIQAAATGEQGLYHEGTRYLSKALLTFGRSHPLLLSSTVRQDNLLLGADLTNPDIALDGVLVFERGRVHLFRSKFLWEGVCYESIRIRNYGLDPVELRFELQFGADYADIFEVRGQQRPRRGRALVPEVGDGSIVLGYEGLDGAVRRTRIDCYPPPARTTDRDMRFVLPMEPHSEVTFQVTIACECAATSEEGESACSATISRPAFEEAFELASRSLRQSDKSELQVYTSHAHFNDWLNRSLADLRMMVSRTPWGPYPYAGVPWFSTPFGRDGVITALGFLWADPTLARGVLKYLAATQAAAMSDEKDAEPGKILHETRKGEMAALGEVPFGRYYGSVDSTPLFVLLAGAYFQRTSDLEFIESIWPNIDLALGWIDNFGDSDRDGFVEYLQRSPKGLIHQGWKDSHDSVFHADGRLADGAIALCEVQAYVYDAKRKAADIALALGLRDRADELLRQAEELRVKFEQEFWDQELGTYVLALDGDKRPCRVRTSNAGHCLFTGIAAPDRARAIARALMSEESFSGWGIRTLSASERRYNPMSYHNGSIWPHDNAMIAAGFHRYGLKQHAARLLEAMLDASLYFDLHRLPELFCGFQRRPDRGPTLYPVACAPQAWATITVFWLLQSCLGMSVTTDPPRILLHQPMLPPALNDVYIHNFRVGDACVDLAMRRYARSVGIDVTQKDGDIEVVAVK